MEPLYQVSKIGEHLRASRVFRVVFFGTSSVSTEWIHPNWRDIVQYALKSEDILMVEGEYGWKLSSWGIRAYNAGFDGATISTPEVHPRSDLRCG